MRNETTSAISPPGVGLVQKTLQILDLFQNDRSRWTQVEIAEATGLPRSTVNRLVRFLTARAYLNLSHGSNRYSLGPSAVDLGQRAAAQFDLRGLCRPVLERLSQETRETIILTSVTASGGSVRCVDQIESTREGLRVFEQIGSIFPLHAGAAPRSVLAALPLKAQETYLARTLKKVNEHTITDPNALRLELAQAQKQGYAVSNGETYEGVIGIASAFIWRTGYPAGSLAVAFPAHRSGTHSTEAIGELLKAAAAEISVILNGEAVTKNIKEATG